MGLKLTLEKTDNFVGVDFIDAYWSIDNIKTENYDGESYHSFDLNTYPSREAKLLNLEIVPNTKIQFGGSAKTYYDTILHTWKVAVQSREIFPNGIPFDEAEQKKVLYAYVKEKTKLPFEDVFEEPEE